jgi:gluconokinase
MTGRALGNPFFFPQHKMTPVPIFVLMGTAGCGKTSVAEQIQLYLGCKYLEGDSLHPPQNVQKMTSGKERKR